jgi:pSer/pThr/pTyr-binding forkhead associated (FHA) protein
MPQCSTCGSVVSEQDKVCPDCGMELGAVVPSGPQPSPATPPASSSPVPPSSSPPPAAPPEPPIAPKPSGQAAAGLAKLTLRRAGALTSESFLLGERVSIGRFDAETGPVDVDLGLLPEGAYLSRHHAEMWRDANGKWFVKDLGSQNGTFLRPASSTQFQRVVQEQPVNDGDEIAFGNARFEFRTG